MLTFCSKLHELQLKISHGIYATDSYVSNFDTTVEKICQLCNVKNNMIHWFGECCLLKNFLLLFEKWLIKNINSNFKLIPITLVFGYLEKQNDAFIINYCLLHAKQFIHKTRLRCTDITKLYFSFSCFLEIIEYAVSVEKKIAINRMAIAQYESNFSKLEILL